MRIEKPGDASSALEKGRIDGALKACANLTKNHLSTQTLAQGNQRLALEKREVLWMLKEVLSRGWSAMSEEGEGGFYTTPQKLAITVLSRVSSVLPTRCRYYWGVSYKSNSEALSVVPTLGQYYRPPG
jgi:hypothetical protein